MSVSVTIRRSKKEETPLLIDIWRRSVDATHDFLSIKDRDDIQKQLEELFPQVSLWVAANDDNMPIAFMLLTQNHIDALFVDQDSRGSGIGSKLIDYAVSVTSNLTIDVNEQNTQAVNFYRKKGFVQIGRSETDDSGRAYPLLHLHYQR